MVEIVTEKQARTMDHCPGCGQPMPVGMKLCWACFKEGENPYKYAGMKLEDWLTQKQDEDIKIVKESPVPITPENELKAAYLFDLERIKKFCSDELTRNAPDLHPARMVLCEIEGYCKGSIDRVKRTV